MLYKFYQYTTCKKLKAILSREYNLHIYLVLFSVFNCVFFLNAQNQNKLNRVDFYRNQVIKYTHINSDSLIRYAVKMKHASESDCDKSLSLLYEAKGYYQKGKYQKSEGLVEIALSTIENTKLKCKYNRINDCYRRLFYIEKQRGNYPKALNYLSKRKEAVQSLTDRDVYYYKNDIDINKCIASVKIELELLEEALKILKKTNAKINKVKLENPTQEVLENFTLEKAHILNLLGKVYTILDIQYPKRFYLDSAEISYKNAYWISKSIKNNKIQSEAYYRLRTIYLKIKKKEYDAALYSLYAFDSLFKKIPQCKNDLFLYKSIAYSKIKQHDSSIFYSNEYLKLLKKNNVQHNKYLISVYNNLASGYNSLKQNDSALKYSNLTLKNYKEIEQHKKATVKNLFEVELSEAQRLNKRLHKNKSNSNTFFIVVLICILVSLVLAYFYPKRAVKQEKEIKKELKTECKLSNSIVSEILKGLSEFEKTTLYLDESFNSNVLADYLKTNTTYLSQVVNQYKEKTFKQYISDLRINYVTEKLHKDKKFQKYAVESIGKEIGYSNASAFTRAFKKKVGVTPSEYIKTKIKEDDIN